MKTLSTFANRVLKAAAKPLALCGLIAGLTVGSVTAARAEAWSFSYSGSGILVSGTITGTMNAYSYWTINSISGTRDDGSGPQAIDGLWCASYGCDGFNANYLAGPAAGAPSGSLGSYPDQLNLQYFVGSTNYIFAYLAGLGSTEANASILGEPPGPNYPGYVGPYSDNSVCVPAGSRGCASVGQVSYNQVPEINASAGLEALALFLAFALILWEMFRRHRNALLTV